MSWLVVNLRKWHAENLPKVCAEFACARTSLVRRHSAGGHCEISYFFKGTTDLVSRASLSLSSTQLHHSPSSSCCKALQMANDWRQLLHSDTQMSSACASEQAESESVFQTLATAPQLRETQAHRRQLPAVVISDQRVLLV